MKISSLSKGLLSFVCTASVGTAIAADRYSFKMETGWVISESCNNNGQPQTSGIQLIIEDSSEDEVAKLTSSVGRVRVCSPFSSPVKENIPLPLPVGLMNQAAKLAVGKSAGYAVNPAKFAEYFKTETPPNYLHAEMVEAGVLQLTYLERASNTPKIGPIRVFLGPTRALNNTRGYDDSKHLPLSRIEIDIREKGVTLSANLVGID